MSLVGVPDLLYESRLEAESAVLSILFIILFAISENIAGGAAANLFLHPLQQNATVSPFAFLAVISGSALLPGLIGHISFNGALFLEAISVLAGLAGREAINLFLHPLQQNAIVSPFSFFAVMLGLASRVVLMGHFLLIGAVLAAISIAILLAGLLELYLAITSSKICSAGISW